MTARTPETVLRAPDTLEDARAELGGIQHSSHTRNAVKAVRRAAELLGDGCELEWWPRMQHEGQSP